MIPARPQESALSQGLSVLLLVALLVVLAPVGALYALARSSAVRWLLVGAALMLGARAMLF